MPLTRRRSTSGRDAVDAGRELAERVDGVEDVGDAEEIQQLGDDGLCGLFEHMPIRIQHSSGRGDGGQERCDQSVVGLGRTVRGHSGSKLTLRRYPRGSGRTGRRVLQRARSAGRKRHGHTNLIAAG